MSFGPRPRARWLSCLALALSAAGPLAAQQQPPPAGPPRQQGAGWLREATRLDLDGRTAEARKVLQAALDSITDPATKAAAWRSMAMSYAFDGDCGNTVKYERMVMGFWQSREAAEPQNAFYQQGEMANEAARVCIDAGDLAAAERWYRTGTELGNKEPEPRTHSRNLWDYRLAHALGRVAARRGNYAEATKQVAAARRALDSDSAMARQQERFFPYLVGYVELYAGDASKAQAELTRALALPGNDRDPFMHALLGMALEKLGKADEAKAHYRHAYELATAHNPPAALARRFAREKLGSALTESSR